MPRSSNLQAVLQGLYLRFKDGHRLRWRRRHILRLVFFFRVLGFFDFLPTGSGVGGRGFPRMLRSRRVAC